ncbi:MAG: hypothetical protein ABI593_14155, partial [Betaproteobacteria bacterium]
IAHKSDPPMKARRLLLCLSILVLVPGRHAAAADAPKAPAPPPCSVAEHRQFDFWLGDWEVRDPAGKVVGHNQITTLHKGCVLFESWSGHGGVTGSSFNIYDAERKRWHQTWVDNSGGLLKLEGGFSDGRMVLVSAAPAAGTSPDAGMNRITWQALPDGRVRQLWETSTDRGVTWKTAFDGFYQKQK